MAQQIQQVPLKLYYLQIEKETQSRSHLNIFADFLFTPSGTSKHDQCHMVAFSKFILGNAAFVNRHTSHTTLVTVSQN